MLEISIILLLAVLIIWAVWYSMKKARRGGGCCPEHEETVHRTAIKDKNRSHYPYHVTLEIGGMTCENCARRVENALNALDGIWAKVDISSHRASVLAKTQPDPQILARQVQEAGYAVTGITGE